MTAKLQALFAALGGLRKDMPVDEAKAFLRQALPLFLDLSPTEVEDAIEWLEARTSLSKSWLRAYKSEIKNARSKNTAQPTSQEGSASETHDFGALREAAKPLLEAPSILDYVLDTLSHLGLVGQKREAALLYLAVTSRIYTPVNVVVKGTSGGGKSFLTATVLRLFPKTAYYELSAMSERALAYSEEPLAHRFLVLYEAAGLGGDFAQYLIRSLLSEGRVRYETVEKGPDKKLRPRLIEREGPTGFITTTTAIQLHHENETRYLSVEVDDSPSQTAAILARQGREAAGLEGNTEVDLTPLLAFQTLLELNPPAVVIPYAAEIAARCNVQATRLRRDFFHLLILIKTHAALHAHRRPVDDQEQVVATGEDYEVVYRLVADVLAFGTGAKVDPMVREVVATVERLAEEDGVTVKQVAREMNLHESSAWRLAKKALKGGFLYNLETRPRAPAKLVAGEPLPPDGVVIPSPEVIFKKGNATSQESLKTAQTSPETQTTPEDEVFSGGENGAQTSGNDRDRKSTAEEGPDFNGEGEEDLLSRLFETGEVRL